MKDKLDDTEREALITYRLDRARSTLAEADFNASGEYFNSAVNRLYYAAYYAASALMLAFGLETTTHAGVKTMLSLHFIKSGMLEPKYGRIFMTLYENRQSGDYEDFIYCDSELYEILKPQSEEFISTVTNLIKNNL